MTNYGWWNNVTIKILSVHDLDLDALYSVHDFAESFF